MNRARRSRLRLSTQVARPVNKTPSAIYYGLAAGGARSCKCLRFNSSASSSSSAFKSYFIPALESTAEALRRRRAVWSRPPADTTFGNTNSPGDVNTPATTTMGEIRMLVTCSTQHRPAGRLCLPANSVTLQAYRRTASAAMILYV